MHSRNKMKNLCRKCFGILIQTSFTQVLADTYRHHRAYYQIQPFVLHIKNHIIQNSYLFSQQFRNQYPVLPKEEPRIYKTTWRG